MRASTHAGEGILIVEDDETIRETLAEILRGEGYPVATAENGQVALERLSEKTPCFVILDLMMPVLNGWQVVDEMQKQAALKEVPICVVSASTVQAPKEAFRVLTKPVNVGVLLQIVQENC